MAFCNSLFHKVHHIFGNILNSSVASCVASCDRDSGTSTELVEDSDSVFFLLFPSYNICQVGGKKLGGKCELLPQKVSLILQPE